MWLILLMAFGRIFHHKFNEIIGRFMVLPSIGVASIQCRCSHRKFQLLNQTQVHSFYPFFLFCSFVRSFTCALCASAYVHRSNEGTKQRTRYANKMHHNEHGAGDTNARHKAFYKTGNLTRHLLHSVHVYNNTHNVLSWISKELDHTKLLMGVIIVTFRHITILNQKKKKLNLCLFTSVAWSSSSPLHRFRLSSSCRQSRNSMSKSQRLSRCPIRGIKPNAFDWRLANRRITWSIIHNKSQLQLRKIKARSWKR